LPLQEALITDWIGVGHWLPESPYKPIGLLGAILAWHANLAERPAAVDMAREAAELAAHRDRVEPVLVRAAYCLAAGLELSVRVGGFLRGGVCAAVGGAARGLGGGRASGWVTGSAERGSSGGPRRGGVGAFGELGPPPQIPRSPGQPPLVAGRGYMRYR